MDFGLISAFVTFLLILGVKAHDTHCEITINQGMLKGSLSRSKKDFCAYTGIPYGEPPLGNLRFRAPRPLKSWEGVLDATKEGNICWQPASFDKYLGDEDCLFINVYTPNLKSSVERILPVMFWIPPGEFYTENNYRSSYEPDLFIDKDILLVTFNYRVGAFGFLSTQDDEAPGNYGMKDQILALHWVRDNIKAFGGDPSRVTIAGISSGAASVHFLLLSPLAKGLFQNAICQEGTAIMPWARHKAPKEQAKKQARILQCPEEPSSALVSCLRNTSALAITKSIYKLFILWIVPSPDYTPVVEKKTERNPEPFLTEDPISILKNGNFEKVPLLMGGNSDPAVLITAAFFNIRILHDQLNVLLRLLPQALMLKKSVSNDEVIPVAEKIKNYYGLTDQLLIGKEDELSKLFSDRYFVHGNHRTVTLHALAGHKYIYFYNFAYRGSSSLTQIASLKNYGVAHADELRYLFRKREVRGYDAEISEFMITLWTNFIKYGDPTSPNASKSEGSYLAERLIWYPVGELSKENMHIQYLNIGQVIDTSLPSTYFNQHLGPVKINMAYDLHQDRMAFWDSLPLEENDGCVKCEASRHLQMSIVTITGCLCLWNSIYSTVFSFL